MSDLPQDDQQQQDAGGGDDDAPQRDAIFSKTHPELREALDSAQDALTDNSNPPQRDAIFSQTHPALRAFLDSLPDAITGSDPLGAKEWMNRTPGESWLADAVGKLTDWSFARDLADRSQAHSEEYTKNVADFKQQLVNMVTNDPTAVSVARGLIDKPLAHMIPDNLPLDQAKAIHADLSTHMHNEVSYAAVKSLATKSMPMAQRMLESSIGDALDPDQKAELGSYIHAQAIARGADHMGQQLEIAKQNQQQQAVAAHRFGEELINKASGEAKFPNGWAARMMADPGVAPEDKNALMGGYGRLQQVGDIAESNGHVIRDAVNQITNGTLTSANIWNAVGKGLDGLSMKDAQWLNGMLHSSTEDGKNEAKAFADALNDAHTKLVGQAGENGASGNRNFNNYAKWLTGAYQKTGLAGLDPNQDGYLFQKTALNAFDRPSFIVNGVPAETSGAIPTMRSVASYFRRPPAPGGTARRR